MTEVEDRARVRRGWVGIMWGEEDRLERKGRIRCCVDGGRGRRAVGKSGIKMGEAALEMDKLVR